MLLLSTGKRLVFVTNNSTKSRAMYKEKFDKMGIKAEVVSPYAKLFITQYTTNLHFRTKSSARLTVQQSILHVS